jgi:rubredoxin
MVHARFCPNCQHETAQERKHVMVKDGLAIITPNLRFLSLKDGWLCLNCGNVLVMQSEEKVVGLWHSD